MPNLHSAGFPIDIQIDILIGIKAVSGGFTLIEKSLYTTKLMKFPKNGIIKPNI